jgi:hypothetical protein
VVGNPPLIHGPVGSAALGARGVIISLLGGRVVCDVRCGVRVVHHHGVTIARGFVPPGLCSLGPIAVGVVFLLGVLVFRPFLVLLLLVGFPVLTFAPVPPGLASVSWAVVSGWASWVPAVVPLLLAVEALVGFAVADPGYRVFPGAALVVPL